MPFWLLWKLTSSSLPSALLTVRRLWGLSVPRPTIRRHPGCLTLSRPFDTLQAAQLPARCLASPSHSVSSCTSTHFWLPGALLTLGPIGLLATIRHPSEFLSPSWTPGSLSIALRLLGPCELIRRHPCCSTPYWGLSALLATKCPPSFEGAYYKGGGQRDQESTQ